MTRKIPLTKGKFAVVDEEDYKWLSKHSWYCTESGYAARDTRNADRTEGRIIYMHKLICPSVNQTDHINRDPLDNRKANLRPATGSLNTANRGIQSNNTSGYKGVSWAKGSNKWSVDIWLNRKKYYLGLFDDKDEAARVYNFWALDIHGEFASLNDIEGKKVSVVARG